MKRKSILLGAVMVLLAVTASMIFAAQDIQIKDPPGPQPCNCPQIYDPVVCRAADGSHVVFSNACFAGCAGYTHCARYQTLE